MSNTTLGHAEQVVQWIRANDGFWDEEALELRVSPLGGVGVFARQTLDPAMESRVLLRLHKDSLLSAQKSRVSNLLFEEGIDGALALVLAFIYEADKRDESPWREYIDTIQYTDDKGKPILPPSLWTKKQKSLLQGTELEMMGALDETENEEMFGRACEFAINQFELSAGTITIPWVLDIIDKPDEEIKEKFEHFIAISHAVASRDFEIDEYHQVALCPGADLFNHEVRNSVRFESFFDVCGACGALACDHAQMSDDEMSDDEEHGGCGDDGCEDPHCGGGSDVDHESGDEEEEDHEDEEQGEEDHEEHDNCQDSCCGSDSESESEFEGPIEDFITHIEAKLAKEKAEDKEEEARESQEPTPGPVIKPHDSDKAVHPDECCDIVLHKKVEAGEEIFNTYGDFSNSILLSKYGFVIPGNINDTVSLSLQIIKLKKKKQYSQHFQWWEESGYEMMREYCHQQMKKQEPDECEDDCEDDCCAGGEEEDDEISNWTMEMKLLNDGEPNALTYALVRLLSMNGPELHKFLQKKTKVNPQVLAMANSKAYKLLKELVETREKLYGDADYKKLIKKGGMRERLAAQLVQGELDIISRAKTFIQKKI